MTTSFALALILASSLGGIRSTTLCTGSDPRDCLPPPAICGDGIVHPTEACDDGNRTDGDGCSMDCKRSNVVAARYRFDRTGVLELPAGMPQPTFDCRLDKWSGSGNLVCDGTNPVTFTPSGNPTAGVPTYWREGGGSTAGSGIGFDGLDDYLTAGDVGDQTGSFTIVMHINPATVASGYAYFLSKEDTSGGFAVRRYGAILEFVTVSATGAVSILQTAPILAVGIDTAICLSYDASAGVLRGNINGIVPTEITNAVAVAANSATLRLGASSAATPLFKYAGGISLVKVIPGVATAAQCASIVNTTFGKKSGVTVTRASPQSVVLQNSDGSPFVTNVPANQLSIGKNGAEIFGARTSRVLWNQRSSANNTVGGICGTGSTWTKRGAATCALSTVPAPDGTMTAEDITVGSLGVDDYYSINSGFASGADLPTSVWIQRISTSGVLRVVNAQSPSYGGYNIDLATIGSNWVRISGAVTGVTTTNNWKAYLTTGGIQYGASSGTVSFRVWRPWQVEGAIAGPDAEVAGSALPVAATAASAEHKLTDPNAWTVRVDATTDGIASTTDGLFAIGVYNTANSVAGFIDASGKPRLRIRDVSANQLDVYAPAISSGKHSLAFSKGTGSTVSIEVDGILQPLTVASSASGIIGTLGQMTIGAVGSSVVAYTNGSIQEVVTCNTSNPVLCR